MCVIVSNSPYEARLTDMFAYDSDYNLAAANSLLACSAAWCITVFPFAVLYWALC